MNVRVEIIANRSVFEDLDERLREQNLAKFHTLFPEVQGVGNTGPRRGDHIWPEENFALVTYTDNEEALKIKNVVDALRNTFPDEGITFFASSAIDL